MVKKSNLSTKIILMVEAILLISSVLFCTVSIYSQNDEEFYRSLLSEYAAGEKDKIDILTKCFETSDWHNYTIHVHSLKSNSKTIGVMDLFEQAAKLEAAANAEDTDTVRSGHDAMIARYKAVTQTIRSVISETDMADDDSEILEFWPE